MDNGPEGEEGNESADPKGGEGTENDTQSDLDWEKKILYDYPRNSDSVGTAIADVPMEASELRVAATFLYWPPAEPSPGVCDSDTELLIKVTSPSGDTRLDHTFAGTLETGTGGESCARIEDLSEQDPAPGEWRVSFRGQGVAVGQVIFQGE